VTLAEMARDSRFALAPGDFVEIVDDDYVLWNRALPLLRVDNVDAQGTRIALQGTPATNVGQDPGKHPLLRRWDQKAGDPKKGGLELRDGAAVIREAHGDAGWMLLEDGVQIQFVKTEPESHFETGDYWLIPARTITEDVIWPKSDGAPAALPPAGPEHYFAPLAIVKFNNKEILETVADCRLKIKTQVSF
jgi:hypothetical protein